MAAISKNVYFNVLDDIVDTYNNTYHRAIKMKPINVKSDSFAEYNEETNGRDHKFKVYNEETNERDPKFKVCDYVKISK